MKPVVREVHYYPTAGSLEGKEVLLFDTATGLLDHIKAFAMRRSPGKLHIFLPSAVAQEERPALASYEEWIAR